MPFDFRSEHTILPGARERINAGLKDIPKINKERPCSNCVHHQTGGMWSCSASASACDFYHKGYTPIK